VELKARAFAERLRRFILLAFLAWAAFGCQYLWQGRLVTASLDLCVAAGTLSLLALPPTRRVAHLNLGLSAVGLFLAALLSGQNQSMANWYLLAIPACAAYQLGFRAALGWWLATSVTTLLVGLSQALVTIPPEFVASGGELGLGRVALGAVVMAFSLASQNVTRRQLAELNEALRRAEASERAKTEFLAVVSHELRTPLNAVLGYNELLGHELSASGSPRALRYVTNVDKGGRRLLELFEDLLETARLQGASTPDLERFQPALIIAACLQKRADDASARGLELVSQGDADGFLLADRAAFARVVKELVDNALKFTARGGRVSLGWAFDGPTFVLNVTDTGCGVLPEDQERVFEPFVQADSSLGRQLGGLGVGLSLCRRVAELHGGSLRVVSTGRPGEGATFCLQLPCT